MKKRFNLIALIILLALTIFGCDTGTTKPKIKVSVSQPSISIYVDEVLSYDFKPLFEITEDGKKIEVLDEYIDKTSLQDKVGSYIVICTYKENIASITVETKLNITAEINTLQNVVNVNSLEVLTHDYKQYFEITDNGKKVEVLDEYMDLSNLRTAEGTYQVSCNYGGVTKTIEVQNKKVEYQLKLSQKEIFIKQSEVTTHDYLQYFTAVVDGKIVKIEDEMTSNNITSNVGVYQYSVSLGETTMSLKVNVISDHEVEIINSYKLLEIEENNLKTFDFTSLFSVYVDKEVRNITMDMIDISSLSTEVILNNIYEIKITYKEGQAVATSTCEIKVIPTPKLIVTTHDIVTYPNGEHIDLSQLFEIKYKNEIIPVDANLITGTINYSQVGNNEITLTLDGKTYTANVEVKQGVIINYAKEEVVQIGKGTLKSTYAFENDFIVLINGIKFTNLKDYINTDNVDFTTPGSYKAVIEIPYTDTSLGYVKGTKFTKEITYEVVDVIYNIRIAEEFIELMQGTQSFDILSNLTVTINGKNQKLTKIASQASAIATYVEEVSEPIDFSKIGAQTVKVAVYVYGPTNDPVYVTYKVMLKSDVSINTLNAFVFEGTTLYTKELFEIKLNNEQVEVTQDMIEGKVNTSIPGVYPVTLTYEGIEKTVNVIVLNLKMVGQYKTKLTTIPVDGEVDEDGYEEAGVEAKPLKDLFITEDGRISVNGILAKILYGIDENTIYIKVGSYEYTLYYNNGIIVLDPNNDIRLSYIDEKRPLIYFDQTMWEILDKVTINTSGKHILQNPVNGYTFDIFKINSLINDETMWYGLYINLYDKMNSDYNYIVDHGTIKFADDFEKVAGIHSSLTFKEKEYEFNMVSTDVAKIGPASTEITYKYAGMTFNGTYMGSSAELLVDTYEGFIMKINNEIVFNYNGASIRNQKYAGVDYDNDIVYITDGTSTNAVPYALKFKLDLENMTFTYIEKDQYFGKYESNNMYLFLDGYGKGLVNFDTTQYAVTLIDYVLIGNEVKITYQNTNPLFEYGEYATFYTHPLNTTLTVKYIVDEAKRGEILVNNYLTNGAIINISSYNLGIYTNQVLAKKALFDVIEIITKDGQVDNTTKSQIINFTDIDFKTKGFYHFSITISVNGENIVMHYAIQIA